MAMSLNSPAFKQNGHIPSKYTCEAEDVSQPLESRVSRTHRRPALVRLSTFVCKPVARDEVARPAGRRHGFLRRHTPFG